MRAARIPGIGSSSAFWPAHADTRTRGGHGKRRRPRALNVPIAAAHGGLDLPRSPSDVKIVLYCIAPNPGSLREASGTPAPHHPEATRHQSPRPHTQDTGQRSLAPRHVHTHSRAALPGAAPPPQDSTRALGTFGLPPLAPLPTYCALSMAYTRHASSHHLVHIQ